MAIKKTVKQVDIVKERLLAMISISQIGDKLPTERSLAEEFGVCRTTVSTVLGELEREGYLARRVGSGTFISSRDKVVRTDVLAPTVKGNILIAYPDFFSFSIFQEVHLSETEALKRNYNLISLKLQKDTDFSAVLNLARATENLHGIILLPPGEFPAEQTLTEELDALGIPVIFIWRFGRTTIYRNIYELNFDHFKSGYLRMKALLEAGHRRIGFVRNEPGLTLQSIPVLGMREALKEYKMSYKSLAVSNSTPEAWQDGMELGYQQTHEILRSNTDLTALLYDTLPGAIGGLRALHEMGKRSPQDISIVTSMEHMGIEKMMVPSLTTVNSNYPELITRAFEIIESPETHPDKSLIMDVTLVTRESILDINQKNRLEKEN